MVDTRLKFELPRAENFLRIVGKNMINNLQRGNEARLLLLPLMQRAYTIVNEIDVLPYKDYDADTEFLEE